MMTTTDDQTPKDTTEADSSAGVSCAAAAGSSSDGWGTPMASEKAALIRHCDTCLAVTAIDLDDTPENAKAMRLRGQTVRVMDIEEAKTLKLERCKCKTNVPALAQSGGEKTTTKESNS